MFINGKDSFLTCFLEIDITYIENLSYFNNNIVLFDSKEGSFVEYNFKLNFDETASYIHQIAIAMGIIY